MPQSSSPKARHGKTSFGWAAFAMSAGTMLSRVLGFARDAVLGALFDRTVTDAFVVGFRLPNLFRRLLGEGALSVSFIPIYLESLKKSPESAQRLASTIFTVLLGLTTTLFALGVVYMPEILRVWVDNPAGYAAVPGKMELTVQLARIMLGYLILVTSYAFCMSVANSLGYFFWPAMAPALFNLAVVIFSFLPAFEFQGDQLAWGVIAGGVAQLVVVFILLVKIHALPSLKVNLKDPLFHRVLQKMGPGVLGLGVFQIMTIVNTNFAARLEEGAQTYIYFADRILELPQSLIAISLGAALLPRFSNYLTDDRLDLLLEEGHRALRTLLFLALPSALGMLVMSEALTDLLFGRGSFDVHDITMTAQVVSIYSALLLATSVAKVLSPGFYALGDTKSPALFAGVCLVVHVALGSVLVNKFGLSGLAVATTFSSVLNMTLLNIFFRKKLGSLQWGKVIWEGRRWILGLCWIALTCLILLPQLKGILGASTSSLVVILVSAFGYFILAALCRAPEVDFVVRRLRRRRAG